MTPKFKRSEVEPEPHVDVGEKPQAKKTDGQAKPSAEQIAEIRTRATKSKQLHASFGGIVSLLMSSAEFRNLSLADLEKLVVPAVTSGQFLIAEAHSQQSGIITPVAAILWASVSEEVDRRLSESCDRSVELAPKDWKSGDLPWLMITAGDKRLIKALQQRLEETVLKGRPLKSRLGNRRERSSQAGSPLN